ncbi:hypothetical protein JCM17845_21770 [Iodidimonas gelatinilytica]|uniref:DUF2336 domain-containing protein n=1 Tax=Iodidimonas gelatinilytica TaxID=1236966 RepID=A0A5A7N1J1_9PROT|nr:DUF2336 domain-containing protein [Iodidimonas gelatinilytica]GER01554.1 hypothetical protein JCM17845_21770 [Iodidimonas gelatinilytica]
MSEQRSHTPSKAKKADKDRAAPHAILNILDTGHRPDARARRSLAEFVAQIYAQNGLSAPEREAAIDVLHRFAHDTSLSVRRALAHCLANTPVLPASLARKLAQDVTSVAEPILINALALTDEDLIAIIMQHDDRKQMAIAKRPALTQAVTHMLISQGTKPVVEQTLQNKGAALHPDDAQRAADRFGQSAKVLSAIAKRHDLPANLAIDIILHASIGLETFIKKQIDLPPPFLENLVMRARDEAVLGRLDALPEKTLLTILRRINSKGHLRDSLVLRAVILGDRDLLEAACAVRAEIGLVPARLQLYHRGPHALNKFLDQCGFSAMLEQVIALAVPTLRQSMEGAPLDTQQYQDVIISRIVGNFRTIAPGSPETVIAQLLRLPD